jgi:putative phage-type endonuclease
MAARAAAVELLPAGRSGHDEPEWLALRRHTGAGWSITASEIPSVMGLDPYTSPFSLWWQKKQGWRTEDNNDMMIGRVLEAGVLSLWERAHPDFITAPVGLLAHPQRRWQMATPDMLARYVDRDHNGAGVSCGQVVTVQAKTAARVSDEWGPTGTDEVPVNYRAQVLWEIDVQGATHGYLAVLFLQDKQFRWYLIDRDERDLRIMLARAERFRASLDADEPPDLDTHSSTLPTVRKLYADQLIDEAVEIAPSLADAYRRGLVLARRLRALNARTESRLRTLMGPYKTASCNGVRVASRSVYPHHSTGNLVDKLTPRRRTP